ncbi:MAG: UxaA family hydrolase [Opitutales bacterium]|nr:UxaA family hydrolase [Opitutales bacterium]
MTPDFIYLDPQDNVVVLARSRSAGDMIRLGDAAILLSHDLGLGHKIACQPIPRGEKILKYGVPIGSAAQDIAIGEHVHLHNMQSDYLPTYTLEAGREFHSTP